MKEAGFCYISPYCFPQWNRYIRANYNVTKIWYGWGYNLSSPSISIWQHSASHIWKSIFTSRSWAAREKLFFSMKLVRIVWHSLGTSFKKWENTDLTAGPEFKLLIEVQAFAPFFNNSLHYQPIFIGSEIIRVLTWLLPPAWINLNKLDFNVWF